MKNNRPGTTEQKPSVHSYIVNFLRDAIVNGDYLPGQRLVEGDLHVSLGVSRPALREALRQLEAERLINIVPFKGPSICEISWAQAQEIYEMRELLEPHATSRFASMATPEHVAHLMAALGDFENALSMPLQHKNLVDSAHLFFDIILDGCENQVIGDILKGLAARISMLRSKSMSLNGRSQESAKEMRAIAEAIAQRNPDEARRAAQNHVYMARKAAHQVIEKQLAKQSAIPRKEV